MYAMTAFVRRTGVLAVTGLIVAMVAAQEPPKAPPSPQPAEAPRVQRERVRPEAASVRLEVTLFKVELAKEKVVELDAKKLAADKPNPAALLKVLQGFGAAEALYRVDQVVDGERQAAISIFRNAPYVVAAGSAKDGQATKSMARQQSGAKLQFRGHFTDDSKQRLQAELEIELSTMDNSALDAEPGVTVPVFRDVAQRFGGELELGKPIVLVTADAAATGTDKPVAYVSLVTVSAP